MSATGSIRRAGPHAAGKPGATLPFLSELPCYPFDEQLSSALADVDLCYPCYPCYPRNLS
jgi:hypothetical protein